MAFRTGVNPNEINEHHRPELSRIRSRTTDVEIAVKQLAMLPRTDWFVDVLAMFYKNFELEHFCFSNSQVFILGIYVHDSRSNLSNTIRYEKINCF